MTIPDSTFNPIQTVFQKSDLIQHICSHLHLTDVALCSLVSKIWYQALQDDFLWKALCQRDFQQTLQPSDIHHNTIHKALYQQFYHQNQKMVAGFPSYRINPEPITLKGLKTYNPQIVHIYTGKSGAPLQFTPYAENREGSTIKNIYRKASKHPAVVKRWIGKVGEPAGILRNDPGSIRTRTKKEISIDCMREKLASDLYQELGRGLFRVPKTRLSWQSMINPFTQWNVLAAHWSSTGVTDSLRLMSRFMEGYQNLSEAITFDCQQPVSLMDFICLYHRPPATLLTPSGTSVPLIGLISLLAVARLLADVDVLGAGGKNVGFIWEKDKTGAIVGAQVVKIDPGYCFSFSENQANWVTGIQKRHYTLGPYLTDLRDLQTSTGKPDTVVQWECLTDPQREEFLATLLNTTRYLQSKQVSEFLFHRGGAFNRSALEQIPTEFIQQLQENLQAWTANQVALYQKDLQRFKQSHPDQLLRIHYIDNWGELAIPMTEETFPIRELFVTLQIVQKGNESQGKDGQKHLGFSSRPSESQTGLLEKVFLKETRQTIELTEIFKLNKGQAPQRVLLTGKAGIGKSTLCQKIAHDWASGLLWNEQFKAVYWIPLRLLNSKEWLPKNSIELMARVLSTVILKKDVEEQSWIAFVEKNRRQSLWIFDGYDEASPQLQALVMKFLQEEDISILVTSRPEAASSLALMTDLHVENIGFSEEHIETYSSQFFSRKASSGKIRTFIKKLKENTFFFEIAHIPLQLQMLCSLWEQQGDRFATHLTGIYSQMIEQMFKWNCSKLKNHSSEALLIALGNVAEVGLVTRQLLISHQAVEEALKTADLEGGEINIELLLSTGIIKRVDEGYTFVHLSFQEYCAAYRAAALPIEVLKVYITEHRLSSTSQLMLPFLSGMLYQKSPDRIGLFFDALCSTGLKQDPKLDELVLCMKCVNECSGYAGNFPLFNSHLINGSSLMKELLDDGSLYHLTEAVKYLYRKELFLPREKGSSGISYFLLCCLFGNQELVEWLCSQNASFLTQPYEDNWTPLQMAACCGHEEMAKWLLSQNASLLHQNLADGSTPFVSAILGGQLGLIKWLASQDPSFLRQANKNGLTPLHSAAVRGHLEVAKWLVSQDSSLLHQTRDDGLTPLHSAIVHGHFEMAKWLISEKKSLLWETTNGGSTPLFWAAYSGRLIFVKWLVSQDSSLLHQLNKAGWTPVHPAVQQGHLEVVKWLVSQKVSLLKQSSNDGRTPLHRAAENGHFEMVKWLVSQDKFALNQRSKGGWTPLHSAVVGGYLEIAKWLISQKNSFLWQANNWGSTPLHEAARNGHLAIAEWICSQDPQQPLAKNEQGKTSFHIAQRFGHAQVALWLQEHYPKGCEEEQCIIL